MNAEDWSKIENLLDAAIKLPPVERQAFLDSNCGDDIDLRGEVESLLAYESQSENFLQSPAIALSEGMFSNEAEETDPLIGTLIGHYKIIQELGKGGMGAVYLAEREQPDFTQRVAIKFLRPDLNTKEIRHRFRRERQILATLEHPNITRLLDVGSTKDNVPFFVMEYVEGMAVNEFCKDLPLEETLKLFGKICEAVTFAHRKLVVHRDLKPSNILITKGAIPKLLDFGISKLLTPDFEKPGVQTITRLGAMTPEYASPEQLRGENITIASDIYSLGVILYELLTNHRPFDLKKRSTQEIIQAVCETDPAKPSAVITQNFFPANTKKNYELNTHLGNRSPKLLRGDLDNIALKTLQKEPERRYATVEKLSEDIERHLQGLPIKARPNTFAYRTEKFVKRNYLGVMAGLLIILSLLGGLTVSLWQANAARKQRDIAQQEKLRSERINKFLQQTLSFSNQSYTSVSPVSSTRNVTVNEMLDNIAPQIEAELSDQPEVLAQVLRTIGSSYASLGNYESAEKNLRKSLAAQTALYGENNTESAATMFELGVLSYRQSKFEESIQLLEKAGNFYRNQRETGLTEFNSAKLAQVLDHLGVSRFYIGNTQASLAAFNESIQISSNANLQGREREVLASAETNLGGVLIILGEIEKGENLLHQGAAEYRLISQSPHWELAANLSSLGASANNRNQPDDALSYLLEGEQIFRQTLGNANMYLAGNINQQANSYLLRKDFKTAEAKARESLAMYRDVFPTENSFTARALITLGDILTHKGQAQEAESLLRRAVEINSSQPKKNYVYIVRAKNILGESLLAQNHNTEAEKVLLETYEEAKRNLPDNNQLTKAAAANLVKLYEKQNKFNLAQKYK